MAAKTRIVGQLAIPLPPQMLRRSLAWQSRRDQRAECRAEFDEARRHGLIARHALKQHRLDRDESLRDLGLMPASGPTAHPSTTPRRHPPAGAEPCRQQPATAKAPTHAADRPRTNGTTDSPRENRPADRTREDNATGKPRTNSTADRTRESGATDPSHAKTTADRTREHAATTTPRANSSADRARESAAADPPRTNSAAKRLPASPTVVARSRPVGSTQPSHAASTVSPHAASIAPSAAATVASSLAAPARSARTSPEPGPAVPRPSPRAATKSARPPACTAPAAPFPAMSAEPATCAASATSTGPPTCTAPVARPGSSASPVARRMPATTHNPGSARDPATTALPSRAAPTKSVPPQPLRRASSCDGRTPRARRARPTAVTAPRSATTAWPARAVPATPARLRPPAQTGCQVPRRSRGPPTPRPGVPRYDAHTRADSHAHVPRPASLAATRHARATPAAHRLTTTRHDTPRHARAKPAAHRLATTRHVRATPAAHRLATTRHVRVAPCTVATLAPDRTPAPTCPHPTTCHALPTPRNALRRGVPRTRGALRDAGTGVTRSVDEAVRWPAGSPALGGRARVCRCAVQPGVRGGVFAD